MPVPRVHATAPNCNARPSAAAPQCGARSISDEPAGQPVCTAARLLWHTLPVTFVGLALAVGDPDATRTVYAIVVALGLIGVSLVVLAIWIFRQTRPEPELLAPLERMSDRSWRKQDPVQMRRTLDDVRPEGAEPVTRTPDPPQLDDDFEQARPTLGRFDDLVELPATADDDAVDPTDDGDAGDAPNTDDPPGDDPPGDDPADDVDAERGDADPLGELDDTGEVDAVRAGAIEEIAVGADDSIDEQ